MTEVHQWPAEGPLDDDEALSTACEACGAGWRIHVDLAGSRLRCVCGAWVAVPRLAPVVALPLHREGGLARVPEALPEERPPDEVFLEELEDPVEARAESNRGVLQLVLMLTALLLPQVVLLLLVDPRTVTMLMPLAGLIGGALVVAVGAMTGGVAFSTLRGASPLAFLEATGVAGLFYGVAMLMTWAATGEWAGGDADMAELVDALGVALGLFTIALCPAVFEEIAFRGLVHTRARRVLGVWLGMVVTAAAFAFAHGVSGATPIHFGIGLYLSWLRERTDSILPGMLLHLLYNGALLLSLS